MNEDVNTVSPTLGFIIRTIDYEGFAINLSQYQVYPTSDVAEQIQAQHLWVSHFDRDHVY